MAESGLVRLGDVAELVRGVSFRPTDLVSSAADGVPLLRATNIGDQVLDLTDVLWVPERLVRPAQHLRRFDVVIAMSSGSRQAVGRLAPLRRDWDGCVGAFCGVIRPAPERVDPAYLGYVLRSAAFRERIETFAVGTAIMNLSRDRLLGFEFLLPPITVQRRVAGTLGALDDKIELNSRMAHNLEAIARAVFRSRFVSGQGGPADSADLMDTPVPVGCRRVRLGDVALTLLGGTPSRAEPRFWGGAIPWLNSGKANEFRVIEASDYITEAGLSQSATKMVPPRTTLVAITGATLGQITVTEIAACTNQSLVAVLGTEELPTEYVYFWLQERIRDLLASQTGAAQQHVNKNDVNALWIVVPPRSEIRDYLGIVRPMFDRIASAATESLTLAAVRDVLLPRLLSGSIEKSASVDGRPATNAYDPA